MSNGLQHIPLLPQWEDVLVARESGGLAGITQPQGHVRFALDIDGDLDVPALERALNQLVRRHDALRLRIFPSLLISPEERHQRLLNVSRTGFAGSGLYLQSVIDSRPIELRIVDLRDIPAADEEKESARVFAEDGQLPFTEPPMARAAVLRFGANRSRLVLTVSHLVADMFSLRILRDEIPVLYEAAIQLPEAPSFAEYTIQELRWFRAREACPAVDYWRSVWVEFAAHRVSMNDLSAVSSQTKRKTGFGASTVRIDEAGELAAFVKQHGVSLHAAVLSGLFILLRRLVGRPRIAIGTNLANRAIGDTGLVGATSSLHLLGLSMADDLTFLETIQLVWHALSKAMRFQRLPLAQLWRVLGCHPFVQDILVVFDSLLYPPAFAAATRAGGVEFRTAALPDVATPRRSPLSLFLTNSTGILSLSAHFSCEVFTADDVQRILLGVLDLLREMLKDPTASSIGQRDATSKKRSSLGQVPALGCFVIRDANLIPSSRGAGAQTL